MKSDPQKINYYLPKTSGMISWFKYIRNNFNILLNLIKLRYPFAIIKFQAINLLTYVFIYPPTRIIFGYEKAHNICNSIETTFSNLIISPLPLPLNSKIILPKDESSYKIYLEIFLTNVYHMETLKKGMNVVDIGSNIGIYTVLAAEKVGKNGKVITIEPGPEHYKRLVENIKLNTFKNVIPQNIALTDHNGSEKLYLNPLNSGGHSLVYQQNENYFIDVLVKTLDSLLEELDIKKIDIIKIDTEGSEMSILKGAEKTLKNNPGVKIFVASYHYPREIEEVTQFLKERGFQVEIYPEKMVMTL